MCVRMCMHNVHREKKTARSSFIQHECLSVGIVSVGYAGVHTHISHTVRVREKCVCVCVCLLKRQVNVNSPPPAGSVWIINR